MPGFWLQESLFLKHLLRQRGPVLAAAVVMLGEAAVTVAMPLPMRFIMNHLLVPSKHGKAPCLSFLPHDWPPHILLCAAVAWLAALCVIASIVCVGQELWLARAVNGIVEGVRRDLVDMLLSRRAAFVDRWHKADIIGRVSGDTGNLEGLLTVGLPTLLRSLPMLIMMVVVLTKIDRGFALAMIAAILTMYLVSVHFIRQVRALEKRARSETNEFEKDGYQALQAFSLIKSLSAERAVSEMLTSTARRIAELLTQSQVAESRQTAALGATKNLMRLAVIAIGGWAVLRKEMLVGDLVLFLSYVDSVSKPVNEISKFAVKRAKGVVAIERIEELAHEASLMPETEGTAAVDFAAPLSLRLHGVSAGYPGGSAPLRRFSAAFDAGDLVAVVGASGSGKSTFLKLLNRLIDPVDGEIRLGGLLLKEYRLAELRSCVTAVSQETFFVAGSVRRNLSLARGDAPTEDELWAALERVGAASFVRSLPGGLEAAIGEGGLKLSGGEERRLGVARAFLRPRRGLFVFDEPTAGLDPRSADRVMASIRGLAEDGAAVVWSTHRLEEAAGADRVIFFAAGERPMMGTHEELRETFPVYRAFASAERLAAGAA